MKWISWFSFWFSVPHSLNEPTIKMTYCHILRWANRQNQQGIKYLVPPLNVNIYLNPRHSSCLDTLHPRLVSFLCSVHLYGFRNILHSHRCFHEHDTIYWHNKIIQTIFTGACLTFYPMHPCYCPFQNLNIPDGRSHSTCSCS